MKRVSCGIVFPLALLAASCSTMRSKPETPPAAAQPAAMQMAAPTPVVSGTVGETAVQVTAKVLKIDLKTRHVTLEGPDGKHFTIVASDRVKNLPQVKKGDLVVATYYQSVAYDVMKPGDAAPGVASAGTLDTAKLGAKPGATGARVTTVTATITGIDKTKQTVTLTGPDGDVVTVKARNPANLDKVKTGDLVQITLTEALAISVEPAQK
jgi:acid stress-induced BolA-like protein IbaG/YrbA